MQTYLMLLTIQIMNFCMKENHASPIFPEQLVHKVCCNLRKWWKGVWSLTRPVLQKLLMVETKPHVWSLVKSMGTDQTSSWNGTALQPWIKSTRLLLAADIQISSRTPSTYKDVYILCMWHLDGSLFHLYTSISKSYRDIVYCICWCIFCSCLISSFDLQALLYSSSRTYTTLISWMTN